MAFEDPKENLIVLEKYAKKTLRSLFWKMLFL